MRQRPRRRRWRRRQSVRRRISLQEAVDDFFDVASAPATQVGPLSDIILNIAIPTVTTIPIATTTTTATTMTCLKYALYLFNIHLFYQLVLFSHRPSLPRLGGHNPQWYDVPSSIDGGSGGGGGGGVDDQLYKEAPTGRGSIADTWYQSPKAAEGEAAAAASQRQVKKPLPPPPPSRTEHRSVPSYLMNVIYGYHLPVD